MLATAVRAAITYWSFDIANMVSVLRPNLPAPVTFVPHLSAAAFLLILFEGFLFEWPLR
jgi:hypothetical protein